MFSFFKTGKKAPPEKEWSWEEFSGVEEEEISADDAIRIGLPGGWFEEKFGAGPVRAESLRPYISDPSVRDLLRYRIEQSAWAEALASVLDESINLFDAIAAGVASREILRVLPEIASEEGDATVGDLVREIPRPVVRELFEEGSRGAPSLSRVQRVLEARDRRRASAERFGEGVERVIPVSMAVQVGAVGPEFRGEVREWFGPVKELRIDQLLLVPQEESFQRVLGWQAMMSCIVDDAEATGN